MEIVTGKRNTRQRALSDDPNEAFFAFKRVRENIEDLLRFSGKSLATKTFFRHFDENSDFVFVIPPQSEMKLIPSKNFIFSCPITDFETQYNQLVGTVQSIIGGGKEKKKQN